MILLSFFIIEYSISHLSNVIKSASSGAHNDHFKKLVSSLPLILKPSRAEPTPTKNTHVTLINGKAGASSSKKRNIVLS